MTRGLFMAVAVLAGGCSAHSPRADVKAISTGQQEKTFEWQNPDKVKVNYLLFLPKSYATGKESWPLMLFLHGGGERGNDLSSLKRYGPPSIVETRKEFPFIVVSPLNPGWGWNPDLLDALLSEVLTRYRVDTDRVYLTGMSMGGFGTWALAAEHPERFAAIVPICGGGNPADAQKLKNLPIWAFHGAKDDVLPLSYSEAMVKALREAGAGEVKFTVYPEAGHDCWTETYDNPQLYTWLLEHKRSARAEKP